MYSLVNIKFKYSEDKNTIYFIAFNIAKLFFVSENLQSRQSINYCQSIWVIQFFKE